MAGICCGVVGESEATAAIEPSASRTLKRRKMELLTYKFIADVTAPAPVDCSTTRKRQKLDLCASISAPRECENASVESCEAKSNKVKSVVGEGLRLNRGDVNPACENSSSVDVAGKEGFQVENAKYGVTSVCGRRRDMEDAVSVHPSFSKREGPAGPSGLHFYGVFDGHGCSHVINPRVYSNIYVL